MKNILPALLMTVGGLFTSSAVWGQVETERMNIRLKDGTTQSVNVSAVKEISFGAQAQDAQFDITCPELYEYYAKLSIAPKDKNATYNLMYADKEDFDQYASVEDAVKGDLQYFQEMADFYGMTLEEVLSYYLLQGDYSSYMSDLEPGRQYVVWAYGMDGKGKLTTPVETLTVTTPTVQSISQQPAMETAMDGTNLSLIITPDNNERRCMSYLIEKSYVEDVNDLKDMAQEALVDRAMDYLYEGVDESTVLDNLTWTGTNTTQFVGLTPHTEYYAVSAYVNDHFAIISPVTWELVTAGDASATAVSPSKAAIMYKPHAAKSPAKMSVKRHTLKRRVPFAE